MTDSERTVRRLPHRAGAVQALEARLRRARRHARDGREGGRGPAAGVRAQAQLVRSRRGHRALRRDPAAALRAPGSAGGGAEVRQGARVLRGRQYPHAEPVVARVEGELLQVHQRDAQCHRGGDGGVAADLSHRHRRGLRGRRLRAGARHRPHHPGRRRLDDGVAPRGAAPRRAAGHRGAHAAGGQAPRAPRPGGLLLHARGRHQGAARARVAPGRRNRPALGARRGGEAPRRRPGRTQRPPGVGTRHRAVAARAPHRGRRDRLLARRLPGGPRPGPRRDHGERADDARADRPRGHPRRGRRLLAARPGPRAGRPDPASARQRGRDRALGVQDLGQRRRRRGP